MRVRSLRSRLQLTLVALALSAIGVTALAVSYGATAALRSATQDRLTAIAHTKRHALERYFEDMRRHVLALSNSETAAQALDEFARAWPGLAQTRVTSDELAALERFYANDLGARVTSLSPDALVSSWLPSDPTTRLLQHRAIVRNPHGADSKDLLVAIDTPGTYGLVHARHHPTFQRYQSGFGFYDIFLITVPEGRVVYTVRKEVDLGGVLTSDPYRDTALGRVFAKAVRSSPTEDAAVLEDFAPYLPSAFAPAAFVAAPVRIAGVVAGVLAMQLSIEEVDRVVSGDRRWRDEGLGLTGDVYAFGADGTLRSDVRQQIENPTDFLGAIAAAGAQPSVVDRIRRSGTSVLTLPMNAVGATPTAVGSDSAERPLNWRGRPVLRTTAMLDVPELGWGVVAQIEATEALAPVRALQTRIALLGLAVAAVFFAAAGWLGASVTNPVRDLVDAVGRLRAGRLGSTVPVRTNDELGQLADAFNRMSEELERTTVSKSELAVLAGRLITAQEEERKRVGRELHDDLVQRVAATAIDVGRLERAPSLEQTRAGLADIKHRLATLSKDVHDLSRRIHPAVLDDLGLVGAIERECRAFMERGGPPVDVRVSGSFTDVSREAQLALYRIAQETLRNIWLHADARDVVLRLTRAAGTLQLEISDDGRGFDRSQREPGLGLASMEERARLLGGQLIVHSSEGAGTRVSVTLPEPV